MNIIVSEKYMVTLVFDKDTIHTANFTIDGFSDRDLEIIRTLSNISGGISVEGLSQTGFEKISPSFPKVSQMTALKKTKLQCSIFGKISQSCCTKINTIKAKDTRTADDEYALKRYWMLRKLSTCTHKHLEKELRKLQMKEADQ